MLKALYCALWRSPLLNPAQVPNNKMEDTRRPDCAERQRLLAELEKSIKETINAKGKPESKAAYAKWQVARKALTRHIEKHGC
jgi:hypothetical protein